MPRELVMIIGGSILQVPAIQEAKKMGYAVLVTDINPAACGFQFADFKEVISTKDINGSIKCAQEYSKKYNLRAVFTAGTDVSYTVASVAHELGLPGIPPQAALGATDKFLMRCCLEEQKVPCPRFSLAKTLDEAIEKANVLGYPLVMKPVDNMGARGVRRIDSALELREQFKRSLAYSGNYSEAAVIIEEYIDGAEISMDTLVDEEGRIHLLTIADRHIQSPPYFIEVGHSIPSVLPEEKLAQAFDVMKQAIRAVGITRGAAKADIRITNRGAVIGEITARLSGGFHSQCTDPLATGMRSTKAALDIALGKPVTMSDITPQWRRTAIERALLPLPGEIVAIKGVEAARAIKGVYDIFLTRTVGDIIAPLVSNIDKVGHVITYGNNRREAEEAFQKAKDLIEIETVQSAMVAGSS